MVLDGKSVVVFGQNGAGKSSFVDAVEANTSGGKVAHLSHEYSGRFQEKGLVNTARPRGQATYAEVALVDGSKSVLQWTTGAASRPPASSIDLSTWDNRRTVLRQEELSEFIRATKGDKYSAILPLLGLDSLEAAAENLRRIMRAIDRNAELQALRALISSARAQRLEVLGEMDGEQLHVRLEQLRVQYVKDLTFETPADTALKIGEAIQKQIASLDADQRRAAAIGEIAGSAISSLIDEVQAIGAKIAEVAQPLIKERLTVLDAASEYLTVIGEIGDNLSCPACGRDIKAADFADHVAVEKEHLSAIAELYREHGIALGKMCDEVSRLQTVLAKPDLKEWREQLTAYSIDGGSYLADVSINNMRKSGATTEILSLRDKVEPLVAQANKDAKEAPARVQTLLDDHRQCKALHETETASSAEVKLKSAEALIRLLTELEKGVREEIGKRARQTFTSISANIQRFWAVLRPSDAIENVRLSIPDDSDKAIEVCLLFHGKEQDSPRLTLSEGQRNALGLCIFLAMASKAEEADRPIILDDVVISFDREHRSRVAALLEQEFSGRQVVLFTHDREWFFELQRTLVQGRWSYRRLIPFSTPTDGVRFDTLSIDLEVARARTKSEPIEAMASVRRIMDVSLGEIAEQIGLALPYLRGGENDHRTAGQFLVALEKNAARSLKKKVGEDYVEYAEAIEAIRNVKPNLAIWANRATHTFSGTSTEAEDLINACEAVLAAFTCDACNSHLGFVEVSQARKECRCGNLRWQTK